MNNICTYVYMYISNQSIIQNLYKLQTNIYIKTMYIYKYKIYLYT